MGATYVQDGKTMDYTPDSAVTAGDVVVPGTRALVARLDIPANALGGLAHRGVFRFPRAASSGADVDDGTEMFWDAAEGEPTTAAEGGANLVHYAAWLNSAAREDGSGENA